MDERPIGVDSSSSSSSGPERRSLEIDRRAFMRKTVLAGGSLTALGPLLAACGGGTVSGTSSSVARGGRGGPDVAFLLRAKSQPRWAHDAAGFEQTAKSLGLNYLVDFLPEDSGSDQLTQATSLLERGIKVLVFVPVDGPSSISIARVAEQKRVKVVGYDAEVGAGVPYAFQVERDNEYVGYQIGQSALQYAPKGNYVIVAGDQQTDVAVVKRNGIMRALKPAIARGDVKVVSDVYNKNWDPANAQVQVEGAIQKNGGNLQAVLSENDGMAVGAFSALKGASLEKKVWLTGEDADIDRVRLIAEGYPGMSVYTPIVQMGGIAAQVAAALLHGKTPNHDTVLKIGSNKVPARLIKTLVVNRSTIPTTVAGQGGVYSCADVYSNVPKAQRPMSCR